MSGLYPQAGFDYQNIVAALKILELIDIGSGIEYIELDNPQKTPHIDDIVITYTDGYTEYYQIKWSGDDLRSYTLYNLAYTNEAGEKSLIEQLAAGYAKLSKNDRVQIILYTTRPMGGRKLPHQGFPNSLSDFIQDVHTPYINSQEVSKVSELPEYSRYKETLAQLFAASKLDHESEFCRFLHRLRFQFSQSSIEGQRSVLKGKLDSLGIERFLYDTLLNAVVEWSLPPRQRITTSLVLERLGLAERFVDRVAHDFKVDEKHYVENTDLFKQLDNAIAQLNDVRWIRLFRVEKGSV